MNTVYIPDGVDDAAVRGKLLNGDNLETATCPGILTGKVWCIGLMGYASNEKT